MPLAHKNTADKPTHDLIAVIDFGSQYTQIITRRVREAGVYSQLFPHTVTASQLKKAGVKGIILSGGPSSVFSKGAPRPSKQLLELGVPVLGICYGLQLLGHLLGGEVEKGTKREYGRGKLKVLKNIKGAAGAGGSSLLFKGLGASMEVWNSHGDKLKKLPKAFKAIAATENAPYAAIADTKRNFYGLQFHPEVAHTPKGRKLIENFLFHICHCKADWKMGAYIEEAVAKIRQQVGSERVVLGLSGGVDSSVAAALIHRAIGDQLTCVFVDNGLLRKDERTYVENLFKRNFHMKLRTAKASANFLRALKDIADPERKRKAIGKTFIDIFEKEIKAIRGGSKNKGQGKDVTFLAQGTLYSDVIESAGTGGTTAAKIKSHHNVGGLPARMRLKLLEPLNALFKDEVRALGAELGLPKEILWRHPFPGPGLAVRCIGPITKKKLDTLREADAILEAEMIAQGHYDKVWQGFCVYVPIKTVGVMGDERTYEDIIALRIVESIDAMTADWAALPHEFIAHVSTRIINEVPGINRVVLDVSSKPPATIEWE